MLEISLALLGLAALLLSFGFWLKGREAGRMEAEGSKSKAGT